jgi:hypothetical protein
MGVTFTKFDPEAEKTYTYTSSEIGPYVKWNDGHDRLACNVKVGSDAALKDGVCSGSCPAYEEEKITRLEDHLSPNMQNLCGEGTVDKNGKCSPNIDHDRLSVNKDRVVPDMSKICGSGTVDVDGRCAPLMNSTVKLDSKNMLVPDLTSICGSGTTSVNGKCLPSSSRSSFLGCVSKSNSKMSTIEKNSYRSDCEKKAAAKGSSVFAMTNWNSSNNTGDCLYGERGDFGSKYGTGCIFSGEYVIGKKDLSLYTVSNVN